MGKLRRAPTAFVRAALSHDGELGVGVVDLDRIRGGWVHELRSRLWLKHLPTPKRPVTKEQVIDFEQGRSLWVETPDTYLFKMDIAAGDRDQRDSLLLCDEPETSATTRMQRFIRVCACDKTSPTGMVVRDEENQWNIAIDPDGT